MGEITLKWTENSKQFQLSGYSEEIIDCVTRKGYRMWVGKVFDENKKEYFVKYITEDYQKESDKVIQNRAKYHNLAKQRFEKEESFRIRNPFICFVEKKVVAKLIEKSTNKEYNVICLIEEDAGKRTLESFYSNKANSERDKINDKTMFLHMLQLLYGMSGYMNLKTPDCFIHRDIKPENIMLNNGFIKYIDFDWSHTNVKMGTRADGMPISGTLLYSHPIQWQTTYNSFMGMDIYSLGMVYVYMIKGDDCFQINEDEQETYWKNDNRVYHLYKEDFPEWEENKFIKYYELLQIIAKMIAQKKAQYNNPDEIIYDFKYFLEKFNQGMYNEIMAEMEDKFNILSDYNKKEDRKYVYILISKNDKYLSKTIYSLKNGQVINSVLIKETGVNISAKIYRAGECVNFLLKSGFGHTAFISLDSKANWEEKETGIYKIKFRYLK